MFDHVVLSVSDYAACKAFFENALAPLGIASLSEGPLGVELGQPNGIASLCIRRPPRAGHLPAATSGVHRRNSAAGSGLPSCGAGGQWH